MIKSGITLSIVTRQRDDHTETKLKRFDLKNDKGVILPPSWFSLKTQKPYKL